jgi:hypothetical protein
MIAWRMDSICFQKLTDIPVFSDGYSLVGNSVANDGSLLFLSIDQTGTDAVRESYASGIGIFPKTRMKEAKRFHLSIWRATSPHLTIDLPELDLTFPLVDIFPDGRILVVGPRCSWRGDEDYDLNAVFDPKTAKVSRILLGDGINSAYVDALGRVWVAYGDEGIFGNFGWGGPGPTPVGAAGLVCFAETGEKIWEYPTTNGMMADCYALNVSGSEATIFSYTVFPICRVSSKFELSYWRTELSGCHEFAISRSAALFSGQYNDPPDAAYLGRFEKDGHMYTRQVRLLLPDGSRLPKGQLLGRGKHLYFFDALSAYRASLD